MNVLCFLNSFNNNTVIADNLFILCVNYSKEKELMGCWIRIVMSSQILIGYVLKG